MTSPVPTVKAVFYAAKCGTRGYSQKPF